ncbi:DedA family protein [Alsobacter sp. SYSU M60028]|uniref:DedA family protein n=1 Tax=Alsobacter ponti TaxID=2962936 RepID=A0ABT1LHW0_9HYPH|nr:DedA family protein [Alsobacter ponti]MCP8940708.1 DedA family protein [Alsobacter ponti]
MSWASEIPFWISSYGYVAIALIIGLESIGIPMPGETALVSGAIYAGVTHRLSIESVIVAAAVGAAMGDNVGFWLGAKLGYPLLVRFGPAIRITEARLRLGKYLFLRHGTKIVFWGRFVALLRTLAAFLAGANRMEWPRFLLANFAGAAVWASAVGSAAYLLGEEIHRYLGPIGLVSLGIAVTAVFAGGVLMKRKEALWQAAADRTFLEPLSPP